ncbi:MAG: M24 family metallopeptidase [Chloroflexota bacterium]
MADTQAYPAIIDKRLEQVRFSMRDDFKVDAVVITYLPNIRYLTNFSGSAATLVIMQDKLHFITDDRYEEQIKGELFELPDLHTHITRDVWGLLSSSDAFADISSIGFEADKMPYAEAVEIRNKIKPLKFKPAPNALERFTQAKGPEELEYVKSSCAIAEQVYNHILTYIKPGITEMDISLEIIYQLYKLGSEGQAFDTIVVSGERGALVHGKPSMKKIHKNDIITMDFGARVNGFCSDITRTVCVGKATKEQKAVYAVLYKALNHSIDVVKPGMKGKTLDLAARKVIEDGGYAEHVYKHSLGHGLGLEVHEKPLINYRYEDVPIPDECVIAIEPGVYIPNRFGIRLEDNVFVTRRGAQRLTNCPPELISI